MSQSQTTLSTPGEDIPNGRGAAAILAAGIGCAAVGVLAILRDAFPPVAHALNFYNPSGPLSGVTTVAVVIWLVAWFFLARAWRNENVSMAKVNAAAFVLLAIGLLLTFPPFMDLLQGK
jgi:asparagine N-glycosylation enzyme membrane subunit Stt3